MKKCPQCGKVFKNLGVHMRVHKDAMQERVQEAEETRPKRPIDRFRTNRVVFGGAGIMRR